MEEMTKYTYAGVHNLSINFSMILTKYIFTVQKRERYSIIIIIKIILIIINE
jgi:hypothetical protein